MLSFWSTAAQPSHLGLGHLSVHRVLRFKDLLNLLLRPEEGGHTKAQVRGQTARKCCHTMRK